MESIEQQLTRKGIDVEELKARSRKRRKRIEKVKKPKHWRPDFDSNKLKQKQKTHKDDE